MWGQVDSLKQLHAFTLDTMRGGPERPRSPASRRLALNNLGGSISAGSITFCVFCLLLLLNLFCVALNMWMLHAMESSKELAAHPLELLRLENPASAAARTVGQPPGQQQQLQLPEQQQVTIDEELSLVEENYVYEMPQLGPPPIYVMIPSVRRKGDEDYLLQILESLSSFPQSNIYVFNNARPGQRHIRWEEARSLYREAHYVRNQVPVPPADPSIYNFSLPFPQHVQNWNDRYNETLAIDARNDTNDRKEWRRKECYDFVTMSRYMLRVMDPTVPANQSWVIFNQDDSLVKVPFVFIKKRLQNEGETLPRVDLNADGLVSVAFRGDVFEKLVEHASSGWCDFVPVDWMVWSFFKQKGYCAVCGKVPKHTTDHIGKVSSRYGRVEGAEEYDMQVKRVAKQKAKAKRLAEAKKRKPNGLQHPNAAQLTNMTRQQMNKED